VVIQAGSVLVAQQFELAHAHGEQQVRVCAGEWRLPTQADLYATVAAVDHVGNADHAAIAASFNVLCKRPQLVRNRLLRDSRKVGDIVGHPAIMARGHYAG